MIKHCVAVCLVSASMALFAQQAVWQPSAGHKQVPIWPGPAPESRSAPGPETFQTATTLIAGKPVAYIENVSRPTLTVYPPKGRNTGAAVVVFPGGGYQILAIDLEGSEACDWLTSKGITCVLLKYRVPHKGPGWNQVCGCFDDTKSSMALVDAQRTLGLVRFHAAEWHIDPHKIGVLGFSAGGHLTASMSTHFDRRFYPPADDADKISCRPDFAIAIYPGHLWSYAKNLEVNPDLHITADTPPTFLLQAEDDNVDNINNSLAYYIALKNAGVHAEMHIYAEGKHAFGLRRTKYPITVWPALVETWLHTIGMTAP